MLAAYGPELGIDDAIALKIGYAFAGGMGRRGLTCGAVSGALLLIGLKYGTTSPDDMESREKIYILTNDFFDEFLSLYHSTQCRDLLGIDLTSDNITRSDRTRIIMEKCPAYVEAAATIIDKILKKENG